MEKKPFLLLEVLVAILIASLCIDAFIKSPIYNYRIEMQLLEGLEGERLADWTFSEIKEKLLKNEIAWDKLPAPGMKTGPFPLPPATIHIPNAKEKIIQRSFTLRCLKKGEKKGVGGETYRLLIVKMKFDPPICKRKKQPPKQKQEKKKKPPFDYRIIVRQLPAA